MHSLCIQKWSLQEKKLQKWARYKRASSKKGFLSLCQWSFIDTEILWEQRRVRKNHIQQGVTQTSHHPAHCQASKCCVIWQWQIIKGSDFKLEGLTLCHSQNKPATQAFASGSQLHASNKQPISLSGICILLLPKDGYWHSLSTLLMNSGEQTKYAEHGILCSLSDQAQHRLVL